MTPRTGGPARPAEQKTVDAVVDALLASGTDLRSVSLDEMKRRLTTALKARRPKPPRAVAV